MQYITVTPAYGRDYTSQAKVRAAWEAGEDFIIASVGPDSGRYISSRDDVAGATIMARYAKLTKIVSVS